MAYRYTLEFIVNYLGFLWDGHRYRIVGSENGRWAAVEMASETMRLVLSKDRGDFNLSLGPAQPRGGKLFGSMWFQWSKTGSKPLTPNFDETAAIFLRDNLAWVEERCLPDNWDETLEEVQRLLKICNADYDRQQRERARLRPR